jgi:hypothetical protein
MCQSDQAIEDRIFWLLDSARTGREICAELGLDLDPGIDMIIKVIRERGTPNLVAARKALDELAAIRF